MRERERGGKKKKSTFSIQSAIQVPLQGPSLCLFFYCEVFRGLLWWLVPKLIFDLEGDELGGSGSTVGKPSHVGLCLAATPEQRAVASKCHLWKGSSSGTAEEASSKCGPLKVRVKRSAALRAARQTGRRRGVAIAQAPLNSTGKCPELEVQCDTNYHSNYWPWLEWRALPQSMQMLCFCSTFTGFDYNLESDITVEQVKHRNNMLES